MPFSWIDRIRLDSTLATQFQPIIRFGIEVVHKILVVTHLGMCDLRFVEHHLSHCQIQDAVRHHAGLHKTYPTVQAGLGPVVRMLFDPITHPEKMSWAKGFRQQTIGFI